MVQYLWLAVLHRSLPQGAIIPSSWRNWVCTVWQIGDEWSKLISSDHTLNPILFKLAGEREVGGYFGWEVVLVTDQVYSESAKNGFKASLKKDFLHFLPIFWHHIWCFSEFCRTFGTCTLHFEKSSNMAKNEEKPWLICLLKTHFSTDTSKNRNPCFGYPIHP